MAITQSLLDFILNLLRDPEAAEAYNANPQAALASAGHGDLSCADVDAVRPVVLDYASVSMDREYNTGGNHSSASGDSAWGYSGGHSSGGHSSGGHSSGGHDGGGHPGGGTLAVDTPVATTTGMTAGTLAVDTPVADTPVATTTPTP